MHDLATRSDIAAMVRRFYRDVAMDALLGPVFNDVARVDWSEHLPKLTAFWCRALLGEAGYEGNPFAAHARINERTPFTAAHFERWLELFHDTIEGGWSGPNAESAKRLAGNVARVHARQLPLNTLRRSGSSLAVRSATQQRSERGSSTAS